MKIFFLAWFISQILILLKAEYFPNENEINEKFRIQAKHKESYISELDFNNLERVILNPHLCSFVFAYAPWNGHARKFILEENLLKLAEHFKYRDDILIGDLISSSPSNLTSKYFSENYWYNYRLYPFGEKRNEQDGIFKETDSSNIDFINKHCGFLYFPSSNSTPF